MCPWWNADTRRKLFRTIYCCCELLSDRTLLLISILKDLEVKYIDFTLDFPNAKLDVDVFMKLPAGFGNGGWAGKRILTLDNLCMA